MLSIPISACEFWDEEAGEFRYVKQQNLVLEHSLVSISKWEAIHKKPFLSNEPKTSDEIMDYIRCMTLSPNVEPLVYTTLRDADYAKIQEYIDDPMTAAVFFDNGGGSSGGIITSETIYYWMISFNIPFECQEWHLNKLLALIKTCVKMNSPKKKRNKQEIFARNAALNAQRRKMLKSKG